MSNNSEAIRLANWLALRSNVMLQDKQASAELRRLHAVELEAATLRAQVERLQAGGEWREVLEAVVREMPTRDSSDGNAPGHGHSIAGIWDSDNGALAGKPCAWCLTWNKAKRLLATPQPEPPHVAPAQALVPLSVDVIVNLMPNEIDSAHDGHLIGFARAIELAHGINGLSVGDGRGG